MPVTNIKSKWVSGDLIFEQVVSTATLHFGIDGTGLDVKFWGDTVSAYVLWDESADKLIVNGGAIIDLTDQASMIDFKAGASSTIDPGASGGTVNWINVLVDGTLKYIPYYTS